MYINPKELSVLIRFAARADIDSIL